MAAMLLPTVNLLHKQNAVPLSGMSGAAVQPGTNKIDSTSSCVSKALILLCQIQLAWQEHGHGSNPRSEESDSSKNDVWKGLE
jgi:hypothetical protein